MSHGVIPTQFVARDREKERASAAVVSGRGAAIVGPTGVGKTALLTAIADRLDPTRYAVIRMVATEAGRELPFGVFGAMFDGDGRPDRLLPELVRRAGTRTPVLVVDDAHHLDNWSATKALTLASHPGVRLLVTARLDAAMPDAVVALWKDGYLRRLDLSAFDVGGTAELAGGMVGGEVAMPTVQLLHQWTGGNPLYLTELIRFAESTGRLVQRDGLWWWRGPLAVPPRLVELFDRRLREVPDGQTDALDAVALGEPLSLTALESMASDGVEALDDKGMLHTTDLNGEIVVRLEQPLFAALLRSRLPRLRRRRLAAHLLAVTDPAAVDLVTRARWQLDAGGPVDTRLLIHAADASYQDDPELAQRLARRAMENSDAAAVPLANALVELGDPAGARQMLEQARDAAGTQGGRLRVSLALAAHRCWVDRDPAGAHQDLTSLRAVTRARAGRAALDGLDALVLLFGRHTTHALRRAEQVLTGSPESVPARLALGAALALTGQTTAARATLAQLGTQQRSQVAYATGAAAAVLGFIDQWRDHDAPIPHSAPGSGQLPVGMRTAGRPLFDWPLLAGHQRWLSGDRAGAIARLREAVVQQSGGQRLFHTEARCWLAICLAEYGEPDAAAQVLGTGRPDRVAVIPGLTFRAAAAIAVARGQREAALTAIEDATRDAREAGCLAIEAEYLAYTMELTRHRAPSHVTNRLATVTRGIDAARLVAVAEAALSLHRGDAAELIDHATRLDALDLPWRAWQLVDPAAPSAPDGPRAAALVSRLRRRIAAPAAAPAELTAREIEVASLAGSGLTDREISRRLNISVRTVQSHLSRIYHKIGVHSRRDLPFGR
ncbi:LuxR C-terminal-related transcriptional regulator [Kutzneria buriramensis]|uniref:Tetratricopeptide repeat protein n=1 Tax=Kutzneria buriramensis TaxID=1045776 RepID=A0A3E0HJI8_9PSEU|nr:LuxR C-terminal-related transcriptional regulator [Kutzneria buriramensis]REH46225.1 tetratricopeptide repeat protein [Kutzneria buriramensis]